MVDRNTFISSNTCSKTQTSQQSSPMQPFSSVLKVRVFDELFCHVEDCINSGGENSFSMGSDSVPPGKGMKGGGGSVKLSFGQIYITIKQRFL